MAIKVIKKIEIRCDTCKKIIATGKTDTGSLEVMERYTEIFCTDCHKLPIEENS